MEILYRIGDGFDIFIDNYKFLLEDRTLTSFEFSEAQLARLHRLYDTLMTRKMEPVRYLSTCFDKMMLPRPVDLDHLLPRVIRLSDTKPPIDVFKLEIDMMVEAMKWWKESRTKFYLWGIPKYSDPRLMVVDPVIRCYIRTNSNPGFKRKYWTKVISTAIMIVNAKMTLEILSEKWIPFVYGNGGLVDEDSV